MDLHEILLASKMSGKITGNADLSDYYTKSQTDDLISGKVDKEDGKGLSTNDFTNEYKSKIDEAAPQSTTYTKNETDQRITTKVAEIVSNAPKDFDTLKGISDWIENHENSAAAMNTAIATNTAAITTKVDKITGKELSTNDFTNALKTKLDSLENYDDTKIKTDIANIVDQIGEDTTQITSIKKILDTSLVSRELLSGSTNDFNDVINSGQYKYNGSPVNKPETQTYGILLVFCPMHSSFSQGAMNYVIQIAFAGVNALHFGIAASAGVYVRSSADSGVTWSKWLKLAFEVTT